MSSLVETLPGTSLVRRLPLSRDQLMLLMAAANEIFLGIDIFLAHSISGTIVPNERIPIVFGPLAGIVLILAGFVALRNRPLAIGIASVVFVLSIIVGLLGTYFHVLRAILPTGPAGQQVTVSLLVWAPPVLAPLTFALVGGLGLSAAFHESPPDSGRLALWRGRHLQLPYSKTRAYLFLVGLGILATLISSVLDHARTNFHNPWLWVPTAAGVLGTVVALGLAMLENPRPGDVLVYTVTMLILIVVGVIGAFLHVQQNLIGVGIVVPERFIRGAPFLAPLLFCNMGALGLITLLAPDKT